MTQEDYNPQAGDPEFDRLLRLNVRPSYYRRLERLEAAAHAPQSEQWSVNRAVTRLANRFHIPHRLLWLLIMLLFVAPYVYLAVTAIGLLPTLQQIGQPTGTANQEQPATNGQDNQLAQNAAVALTSTATQTATQTPPATDTPTPETSAPTTVSTDAVSDLGQQPSPEATATPPPTATETPLPEQTGTATATASASATASPSATSTFTTTLSPTDTPMPTIPTAAPTLRQSPAAVLALSIQAAISGQTIENGETIVDGKQIIYTMIPEFSAGALTEATLRCNLPQWTEYHAETDAATTWQQDGETLIAHIVSSEAVLTLQLNIKPNAPHTASLTLRCSAEAGGRAPVEGTFAFQLAEPPKLAIRMDPSVIDIGINNSQTDRFNATVIYSDTEEPVLNTTVQLRVEPDELAILPGVRTNSLTEVVTNDEGTIEIPIQGQKVGTGQLVLQIDDRLTYTKTVTVRPVAILQNSMNLRLQPSETSDIKRTATSGERLLILGKNAAGEWWWVRDSSEAEAWINNKSNRINSSGDTEAVPVVDNDGRPIDSPPAEGATTDGGSAVANEEQPRDPPTTEATTSVSDLMPSGSYTLTARSNASMPFNGSTESQEATTDPLLYLPPYETNLNALLRVSSSLTSTTIVSGVIEFWINSHVVTETSEAPIYTGSRLYQGACWSKPGDAGEKNCGEVFKGLRIDEILNREDSAWWLVRTTVWVKRENLGERLNQ